MIEGTILKAGKPAFDVHLDHINAVADTPENAFLVDLDAVAGYVARVAQVTKEPTVTTTEVENAFTGRNPVGDHGKVETLALLGLDSPLLLGHTAMFSR